MKYELLINEKEQELTENQKQFLNLHNEIMYCGNQASFYVVELAKKLRTMRDEKIYIQAEFSSFGEYVENAVGIKERQAYNYISILENLPEEFLQLNAKIGITKLSLLAPLSQEERENVVESIDVENATVKELQAQIEEERAKVKQLTLDLEQAQTANEITTKEADKDYEEQQTIIKDLKQKLAEKEEETTKAENKVKELENAPKEVVTVENPQTQAELKQEIEHGNMLQSEVEMLKKKLAIAENTAMSKFKVKFEDWQKNSGELFALIKTVDTDLQEKCRQAVKTVIGGWNI